MLVFSISCHRSDTVPNVASKTITILGWSEYIPDEVLTGFEAKFHVKPVVEVVDSNEAMLAKMQAGGTKYDVVQPSEYLVEELIKLKMLAPLKAAAVPNLKTNILPDFLDQSFDPGNQFSVPYLSGTVGIVYNADKIKAPISGFADVFKPEHAGRIIVVNDKREIVSWAMILKGIPINDMSKENLDKVKPLLTDWIKLIKKYDSDSPKTDLLKGNVDIGVVWNGEAALVLDGDSRYRWVVPGEGTHRYIDNLAVPSNAPNPADAQAFLNYCLEPEVGKIIAEHWPYTSPNGAARKLLTDKRRANPASYPTLDHPQTFHDIGAQAKEVEELMTGLMGQ